MMDLATFRSRFPILAKRCFLNTCSYGAVSLEVQAALERYTALCLDKGSDWIAWIELLERVRAMIAATLGAPARDIAISSSVSEAVNALASALRFESRRRVVLTAFDFPTTAHIWRNQARRGAECVTVEARDGRLDTGAFERLIDDRTAIVSVPSVCYWNGARIDIEPIVRLAHDRGATVLVDAYQAAGTIPTDWFGTGADFIVGGCTKYLLGGAGIGYLYVRDSERSALDPAVTGWFAQRHMNEMDASVHDPAPDARRFEAGTPPIPALYCAEAGLKLLGEVSTEMACQRVAHLASLVMREAQTAGYTVVTPMEPGTYGAIVAIQSSDAPSLVDRLGRAGVLVTSRAGNIRISLHAYNDESDISALFATLARHRDMLV